MSQAISCFSNGLGFRVWVLGLGLYILGFRVRGLGFGAWAPIGKSLTRIYTVQSERSGEYGTGALKAE